MLLLLLRTGETLLRRASARPTQAFGMSRGNIAGKPAFSGSVTPSLHTLFMTQQLRLISTATGKGEAAAWRLDEHTRQIGRDGLAAAREALRQSRPRYAHPETTAA